MNKRILIIIIIAIILISGIIFAGVKMFKNKKGVSTTSTGKENNFIQ